ncbi:MAG: molybdate ABC transporter permease subunit [Phycisphaerae bacterium]
MLFTDHEIHAIRLSLQVSTTATALFLVPAVAIGVWLARTRSRWRAPVQAIVMIPLVLPPVATGLCLLHLLTSLDRSLAFTPTAAILASGVVASPLLIRTVRAGVEAMDPRLLQVAATLGASRTRAFITITTPVCWKAIVGGAVLFWARAMGEFGAVMVVAGNMPGRTQTISLAIYSKLQSTTGASIWPLVAVSVAVSLLAIALSEWLIRDKRATQSHRPASSPNT